MSIDPQTAAGAAAALGVKTTPEQAEAMAKSLSLPLGKVASFRVGFDVEPAFYQTALEKGRAK
jgi:hypothetical protein